MQAINTLKKKKKNCHILKGMGTPIRNVQVLIYSINSEKYISVKVYWKLKNTVMNLLRMEFKYHIDKKAIVE